MGQSGTAWPVLGAFNVFQKLARHLNQQSQKWLNIIKYVKPQIRLQLMGLWIIEL